jgi:hypothetical protein
MEDLDKKIIELMDLFDDEQVTTADKIDRPERAVEKQAIDDFMKRNPMAGGGTIAGGNIQGEQIYDRFGFKLPRFVTKDPNNKTKPYRVKIKKSELNPEPFSGNFRTLKEARAVASKYKAGVKGPSVNLQLIENAQSVVDDYNKIVDKAVANRNLTGVGYFETYVKNKFPNKSDQTKILRRVYDNKIDYRDLTQVRKTLAKDLINLAMEQEKIVPLQFVYDRLGATRSAKLSSDLQQMVNKGLKNQTKIKVDRAIQSIVEADEIIDDSLMKTVADKIGRSYDGTTKKTGWKKAYKENSYYKKNKKILDYAFTAGGKSSRAPGMSLSEVLDDAKYKIGGGVTFSGKQTQFAGLRRYIFDYAKSHWHRNNFDGNPGKSLIEFYDKNGKPIKWKSGLKLKLGEVQFKIPSESDVMWSYNGAPKGSVSVTGPIADSSGVFKEVTETYDVMKEISDAPVTNPITGKETTYNKLVSDIYKKGYGYQGKNIFGLDIDHFKGVRDHPFKNLRAMDRRLNISLGAIDKTFDNRNLKAKLKNEILGELATTTGSNYNQALKTYFVNQATNVLDKGIVPTLATESPYYSAVKNVYEQRNLPKGQKELLEKSYQRAIKLENSLLKLSGQIDPDCAGAIKQASKDGGRIGLKTIGSREVCITKARNYMSEELIKGIGTQQNAKTSLIKRIIAGSANFLKQNLSPKELLKMENLIGKPALYGAIGFETGLVADDVFRKGKPLNVAAAESLFGPVLNLDADAAKAKNILESNVQLSPAAKEYAQNIIDYDRYRKNELSFPSSLVAKSMPGSDRYFKMQEDLKNKIMTTPDTGALDYQSALTESEAIFKAKPKKLFGLEIDSPDAPEVTPLTNKLARPSRTRGPMTTKQDMKVDLTPITYQNFQPNIPSKEELEEGLRKIGMIGQDEIITDEAYQQKFYRPEEFSQLFQLPSFTGANQRFEKGGRAGFKKGTPQSVLRKGILELIDDSVKKTPKDTTSTLDKLIKKTLDEDFFDKKDRIIDQLDITAAKKRKNFPYNQKVQEEPDQLEFYDDITKSNFRTKTGPFFDRRKRAGGGILKQAGDSSGPPPESGPMSQGLQGLMKRGIKT